MIVEDTYLIPFLQLKKIPVKPFLNDQGKLCFEIPEEAIEAVTEFYTGNPQVLLGDYVSKLKQVRSLLFGLRGKESGENGKERTYIHRNF